MQPNNNPQLPNANPEPPKDQPLGAPPHSFTHSPNYLAQSTQPGAYATLPQPIDTPAKPAKTRRKLKKSTIVLLGVIGGILLIGGVVFGYYLPNTPENVWKTGMKRTNTALTTITETATDETQRAQIEKTETKIRVSASNGEDTYELGIDGKSNEENADYRLAFKSPTMAEDKEFVADLQSRHDKDNAYPDLYFKLSDIALLGGMTSGIPELAEYDNRWIAVNHTFFEEALAENSEQPAKDKQEAITSKEVSELIRTAQQTIGEYLFTNDPDKAIMRQEAYAGKEESYGKRAYKYKVSLNEQNYERFCADFATTMTGHSAYRKLPGLTEADMKTEKTELEDECKNTGKEFAALLKTDGNEAHLWIDAKTKLVHKFSLKTKEGYVETGQNYSGGESIEWFTTYESADKKTTASLKTETNLATDTIQTRLDLRGDFADKTWNVRASLDVKPYAGEINGNGPAQSTPIQEVIEKVKAVMEAEAQAYRLDDPQIATLEQPEVLIR